MEALIQLFKLDLVSIVIGIFIILSAVISMITIFSKFMDYIGKPLKWIKDKENDHKLIITTANELVELRNQRNIDVEESIRHDVAIRSDLAELKTMFIEREIDTMRWEIINFSTRISEGKPCNRDSYKHCLRTYEKYEKMLEDNNMTNGEVDLSMDIINESYKEKLKNGF